MLVDRYRGNYKIFLQWLSVPSLLPEEATALCMGFDPTHTGMLKNRPDWYGAKDFQRLEHHVSRQFLTRIGHSSSQVIPEQLMNWAQAIELELSEELSRASAKLFSGNQKHDADQNMLQQQIEVLTIENARLTDALTEAQKSEIDPKSRASLLTIVLGVALEQYNWDPKLKASKVFEEIASDVRLHGLSITAQTIRKHLRNAHDELLGQAK